jgi:cysteine dioxygenase
MGYIEVFKEIDKQISEKKEKYNNPASLKALLQKYVFKVDDFKHDLIVPDTNPYGRKLVFSSPNYEVILMNWKPKNESNIHNHGASFGCVVVLKGQIINNLFDENTKIKSISIHTKGDHTEVPKDIYHQIKNSTDDYAVTMHFYSPPLKDMKVLDKTDIEKKYVVKCNCGAWNPQPGDIKETIYKDTKVK